MYPAPFNDFKGPRGEFLKCLAELGEDPAFIRRLKVWMRLGLSYLSNVERSVRRCSVGHGCTCAF